MFCTILLMAPFLLVLTAKDSYYPAFWKLVRAWSYVLVYGMGFRIKKQIDQELDRNQSYMFCPNHASFMDPFVLIVLSVMALIYYSFVFILYGPRAESKLFFKDF